MNQTIVYNGVATPSEYEKIVECFEEDFQTNMNPDNMASLVSNGCLFGADGGQNVIITRFELYGASCNAISNVSSSSPVVLSFNQFPFIPNTVVESTINIVTGCSDDVHVTFKAIATDTFNISLIAYFNDVINYNSFVFQAISPGDTFTYNVVDCTLA